MNKLTEAYVSQEHAVLEAATGNRRLRALREIFGVLAKHCVQLTAAFTENAISAKLDFTLGDEEKKRILASWKRLDEETRMILVDALLTKSRTLVRATLMEIVGHTEGYAVPAEDPLRHIAPLDDPPSEGLTSATAAVDDLLAHADERLPALTALEGALQEQSLSKETDITAALEELSSIGRIMPEYAKDIRALYAKAANCARELFAQLRPLASLPAKAAEGTREYDAEFIRLLAETNMKLCDRFTERGDASPGVGISKALYVNVLRSVMQALALTRIIEAYPGGDPFPAFADELDDHEAEEWRQTMKSVTTYWGAEVTRISATLQSLSQRVESHWTALPSAEMLILGLESIPRGIHSTWELWHESACMKKPKRLNEPTSGTADLLDGMPAACFAESSARLGTPPQPGSRQKLFLAHFRPADLPQFITTRMLSSNSTCTSWMIDPKDGLCPDRCIIPYRDILPPCDALEFARLHEGDVDAMVDMFASHDPALKERLPSMRADHFVLCHFDPDGFLAFAEEDAAFAHVPDFAQPKEASESAFRSIVDTHKGMANFSQLLAEPRLISYYAYEEHREEDSNESEDDSEQEVVSELRRLVHVKHLWPSNEVKEILDAAGIVVQPNRNSHWKLEGPRGIRPMESTPLKQGEWHPSTLFKVIAAIGNVAAAVAFMRSL